jgi:predicted nuclease with TOPRIM domain
MGRSYKQEKSNYLQGEKNIVEAELRSIKGAYFRLKDQVQSLALELSSMEKALEASYNQVIPLRKELFPAEDS